MLTRATGQLVHIEHSNSPKIPLVFALGYMNTKYPFTISFIQ